MDIFERKLAALDMIDINSSSGSDNIWGLSGLLGIPQSLGWEKRFSRSL